MTLLLFAVFGQLIQIFFKARAIALLATPLGQTYQILRVFQVCQRYPGLCFLPERYRIFFRHRQSCDTPIARSHHFLYNLKAGFVRDLYWTKTSDLFVN